MSPEHTARQTPTEVAVLREVNARLAAQLGRIVGDLERRDDVDVRVDLDAPAGEAVVVVGPAAPPARPAPAADAGPLGGEAAREVREVALRLEHVQRDLVRIQQNVEKLLWRLGDRPPPPLAAPAAGAPPAGPGPVDLTDPPPAGYST